MKLSDWAKKQGISYITAWRWFNDNRLPVKAYRSDSGTIIVQDESESSEQVMGNNQSNDIMSIFLKKTVEFSKNNGTVEDFAAWVLSNFQLKLNIGSDSPKYSRNKPKTEDVQKHFQQFIKKGEKPKPTSFVASEDALNEIVKNDGLGDDARLVATLEVSDSSTLTTHNDSELSTTFSELLVTPTSCNISYNDGSFPRTHDDNTEGFVIQGVDSTPQLNYTSSNNAALGTNFTTTTASHFGPYPSSVNSMYPGLSINGGTMTTNAVWNNTNTPPEAGSPVFKAPARRGRKPAKSFGK